MNGNKIIAFVFLFTSMLILIPFNEPVKALGYQNDITFEFPYGVKNLPYSDGFLTTKKNNSFMGTARFSVNDTYVRSGSLNFKIVPLATTSSGKVTGWFNFSYDKSMYMTGFNLWIGNSTYLSASGDGLYFIFYNETTQGVKMRTNPTTTMSSQSMVSFKIGYSTGAGPYYIQFGGLQYKTNMSTKNEQISCSITSPAGYQTLSYTAYDGDKYTKTGFVPSNSSCFTANCRIDRMIVVGWQGAVTAYLDDITFNISDSYASGYSGGCGYDVSGYNKLGVDNTPYATDITGYQIMKIYDVHTTGYLKGVSLCITPAMYDYDSDLSHYTCKILGFPEETADCLYLDGYNYRLFWSCSVNIGVPIQDQTSGYLLYAQFFHRTKIYGNVYWQVCIGNIGSDLDSDGNTYFKYGNTNEVPQTKYNRDLGSAFYVQNAYPTESYTYTDGLGLQNYLSKNATGFLYPLGQPEGIVCSYLLGTSAYTYKLEIYRNNTASANLTKTYNSLPYPSGVVGYCPITIGKYIFKLYNYHYVANVTAWVSGSLNSYFITTDPTITNTFESYNIYYKFFNSQGKTGLVGIFRLQLDSGFYDRNYQHITIGNNLTYSTAYSSTATDNEYLTLFINNTYKSAVAYCKHYIRNPNVGRNYILVTSKNTEITTGNPEQRNVTIVGSHLYPACDVSVYINGVKFESVKENQVFTVHYIPTRGGNFNASLRLKQVNDTIITLDYCHFTVTENNEGTGEGEPLIEPPLSYIVGIFVILAFLLIPLSIAHKLDSDILKFVSIATGIIGFIATILLGLLPAWTVAVFIALIVVISLFLYMSKKQ